MTNLIYQVLALVGTGAFTTIAAFVVKLLHINIHTKRAELLEKYAIQAISYMETHEGQVSYILTKIKDAKLKFSLPEIEAELAKFVKAAETKPVESVEEVAAGVGEAAEETQKVVSSPMMADAEDIVPQLGKVVEEVKTGTAAVSNFVGKIAPQATALFESEATK